MNSTLSELANRPAASITDAEVATAIEIMLADPRVMKAVHVGREDGKPDGRQMIDFEIPGFAGVYALGRVISAFGEADRLAAAAAEKARVAEQKKAAALKKKLANLSVPREGDDEEFDDWADGVESDLVGVYGALVHDPDERALLYLAYLEEKKGNNRRKGAKAGVKTRAKNEAKGISQKGLTGSTKQKRWASEIRGPKLTAFSEENRKFFEENEVHAGFWIAYRDVPAGVISSAMDRIYAELQDAIRARVAYAEANATPQGVLVTPEYSRLHDAVMKANSRWHKLLAGDLDVKELYK